MDSVVLDTNIVGAYVHRQTQIINSFESQFPPSEYTYLISIVTRGELYSIARQNGWGIRRLDLLDKILAEYLQVRIDNQVIVETYAVIDAYSQKPTGLSARNMGKNDLWIAATAVVCEAALATTDADFDHLDGHHLAVFRFQP